MEALHLSNCGVAQLSWNSHRLSYSSFSCFFLFFFFIFFFIFFITLRFRGLFLFHLVFLEHFHSLLIIIPKYSVPNIGSVRHMFFTSRYIRSNVGDLFSRLKTSRSQSPQSREVSNINEKFTSRTLEETYVAVAASKTQPRRKTQS